MRFLDAAPTAYHAVEQSALRLQEAGFIELRERTAWKVTPGNRYFVRRENSSLIAFRTGAGACEDHGFRIAAAHTDSPGFKIKPDSEHWKAGGLRVGVEVYGSPIRSTWIDQELGIAGRVVLSGPDGAQTALFDTGEPVAVIPNVALHLNREMNKGVEYNPQTDMCPVLSVSVSEAQANGFLRRLIAEKLAVDPSSIDGYDLYLYPAETARIVGAQRDMFMSGRIDNLAMSHAVLSSLIEAGDGNPTLVAVFFDSEEIGSMTLQGARSWFLRDILRRITLCSGKGEEEFLRALASSFLISGDAAHAVHPNYSDKHDERFSPQLNKGPVVKMHGGGNYTTTAITGGRFISLCRSSSIPVQCFINRSDMPTGGTIGPVTSAHLGVPSVDVGNPIWSMHSARETAGVKDHEYMTAALLSFFKDAGTRHR